MGQAIRKIHIKRLFCSIKNFFTKEIDRSGSICLLVYFAAISILELLAYLKNGIASVLASRLWFMTGLFCLLLFVCYVIKTLTGDIKAARDGSKNLLPMIGFFVVIGIFCCFIGNIRYADINPDATQQVAAGLSSFSHADWNYTGTAFLGYANRQYIIAALPAVLFGRSITTLHLGFAYPFLIGLTVLFLELRTWMKQEGQSEALALLPVYGLLAFPFITEYFLNFEQAITPVALTMMGIALFLRLYRKPDILSFLCLSYVGCLFCNSYTPVIASLGLLLCFLVLTLLKLFTGEASIKQVFRIKALPHGKAAFLAISICGLIANIVCFFLATLLATREDRLDSVREGVSLLPFILKTWAEFFTDANAVFLGIFLVPVILYLLLSLSGRLKFRDVTVSCWVLGVVVFANYMTGYDTAYEKSWILQRNMIIIPVLAVAMFFALARAFKKRGIQMRRGILVLLLSFFTLTGLFLFRQEHQSFRYFRHVQPLKFMIAYTEESLEEYGIKDTDEFNLILYTDNLWQSNLRDYAAFFYPNATVYSLTSGQPLPDLDFSLPIFLFAESEQELINLGPAIESKTYENPRYKTTATWYRVLSYPSL